MAIPQIDLDICTGCGDCIEFCPSGIVGLVNNKAAIVSPEDYARHLWGTGSVCWMGKAKPNAMEYLLKEAKAFREFYPEVSFEVVESGDAKAELVFTDGCLGGWGRDPWAVARNLGLSKKDICAYCWESFRVWTRPLGLRADIGPKKDENCRLRVTKP